MVVQALGAGHCRPVGLTVMKQMQLADLGLTRFCSLASCIIAGIVLTTVQLYMMSVEVLHRSF